MNVVWNKASLPRGNAEGHGRAGGEVAPDSGVDFRVDGVDVGDVVAEGHGRAGGEVAPDFGVELRDVRVDGGNVVTVARVDGGKILDKIGVCVNDLERIVRNAAKKRGQEKAIRWRVVCSDAGGESASIDAVEEMIIPGELDIVVLGRGSFRPVRRVYRYRLKAGIGRGPWAIAHRSKLGISKEPNKEGTAGRVDRYDAKDTPFVMLRTTTALSRVYAPDVFGGEAPTAGEATTAGEGPTRTIRRVCGKLGGANNRMSQTPAWSTTQNVPWGGKYWDDDEEDLSLPDWFYKWETGALLVGYMMGDGSAPNGTLTIRATDLDEVLLVAEAFLTIFECEGMEVFVQRVNTDGTVGIDLDRRAAARHDADPLTCHSRLVRSPG